MIRWSETRTPSFAARHAEHDADGARATLELLEAMRERLALLLPAVADELEVVVHPGPGQLALAQPVVPLLRALTAPPGRSLVAGELALAAAQRQQADRGQHAAGPRRAAAHGAAAPRMPAASSCDSCHTAML